ncbi:MAG: DNA polymerase III subunit delta [Firmicutes bacterium]|nr:DNA polymerase III subunit delta [Bacillota bacterium]
MDKSVYLFYGNDNYLLKSRTEKCWKEAAIEEESVETYDFEETSIDEVLSSAMTIPFLTEKKAVVWTNALFLSTAPVVKELTNIEIYLENPNPSTIFIIVCPTQTLDKKRKVVKMLLEKAEVVVCNKEEHQDLYGEIKRIIKENGKSIDANALQQFISRVGTDSLTMMNELDKLLLFSEGIDKIDIQMVRDVTTRNLEENIFTLVNALLAKDHTLIMHIYKDLLTMNIDPVWMMGVIMNKFQEILYTKELIHLKRTFEEIMKYFQASKGRVYYMVKNAKDTSDDELYEYMSELETLDYQIKSGQIDKFIGIEMFLYRRASI